ncbi:MAG: sulfite exporter TauE/SafE family protein [Acidobacteria bacterium]|nr:sulfite exporter TauE/SafE family protein [Acidobacteriota bacterium]
MTLHVAAVLFCATFVRSALGFGEALIAVPLLALALPVETAAPVAVLVSITVAAIIVAQDWRDVQVPITVWLVLSSMIGIPLGLVLLRTISESLVKGGLGVVVAGFATATLLNRGAYELKNDRLAWLFGVAAGILGGAYGMNGPPLVVYGALRRWSPGQFRATLQGYFLPASVMGMIGYWAAGLWTPSVTRYYVVSLPAVLLAIAVGRYTGRRIDAQRFLVYVHVGLLVIGAVLLFQAVATSRH